MKQTVYLLCGCPASGKSTWAKRFCENDPHTKWVSRDNVRFEMLGDNEEYFTHETEVFDTFITKVNDVIKYGFNVIVDATHLTPRGRAKVLNRLDLTNCVVIAVWFNTPLSVCIARNRQRTGRAYVPKEVIRRFFAQTVKPSINEKFIDGVRVVNLKGGM